MSKLFANAQIIDWIVVMILAEGLLFWMLHRIKGVGPSPERFSFNLLAGAALLLALRAALTSSSWMLMAFFLGSALLAHLLDLRVRWSEQRLTPRATAD